jgi:Helix-turn-helix domain
VFEIGSSLREARTRQGLDFNEMEFRTKVRAKYLRALEEERFDQLPAHTYIKGFLRTYADALGMDGQLYVDEYNSRYVAGEEEHPLRTRRVPTQSRHHRQHRESRLVVIALTAIVILTALVIAAWKFGGPTEPKVQGVNVATGPTAAVVAKGVSVSATRGASFMEVRGGSGAGTALYRGTLERGQTKRFAVATLPLTLAVASPGNVVVRVAGVRLKVPKNGHLRISPRS